MISLFRGARLRALLPVCAVALLALTGCGSPTQTAQTDTPKAASVTVQDPWVKATDGGMTALFATLHNPGSSAITVLSASTPSAPVVELHEVVTAADGSAQMRPKEGGFVIEPGADHALAPGADHIMLMDLPAPIHPGDEVDVTLALSDGTSTSFKALAKDTTSGTEQYAPGSAAPSSGMSGMHG